MGDHALHDEGSHVEPDERTRFTRPAPAATLDRLREQMASDREDEPPPDVPRDQWERPLIVSRDGSQVTAYIRASKYGKRIEDYYALHRWDERNIVWGMSRGHHLVVKAAALTVQTGKDNVAALQDVAERAKIIAGADSGAITGTGLHKLSQRRDAQEDLSWLDPTTLGCLDAYEALLAPFEVLAAETFVVCDELEGAGSFDRAIRLVRDIVWPDGVIWPAGMIVIIDVKTGKVTSMSYWACDFSCQQLIYASGEPYLPGVTILEDPAVRSARNVVRVDDQPGVNGRIGWDAIGVPGGPSQRWAMILHVPALEPWLAHWERVDLDVAREDAAAAQQAWERGRVKRAARFLALPSSALELPPGWPDNDRVGMSRQGSTPVDSAVSEPLDPATIDAAKIDTVAAKQAQTTATLRQRIERADDRDKIDALYDAWHASPAWTEALTEQCAARWSALTPPRDRDEDVATCDACNYDRHQCRACGVNVPHGMVACVACSLRVALDTARTFDALETLWIAHGPGGDDIWTEEHTGAAQARYDALEAEQTTPRDRPGHDVGPCAADDYPMTITDESWTPDVITLWCHECLLPPGHPQTDDPIAWCDCNQGETCFDAATACRQRAHAPEHCPTLAEPLPEGTVAIVVGPSAINGSDEFTDDAVNPVATEAATEEPEEPGPFDDTLSLADLRTAITEALTVDALNALYDAHSEDGTNLWDDECNTLARDRYDALAPAEVSS